MTKENAKANLEFITAFANGEEIQFLSSNGEWCDSDDAMVWGEEIKASEGEFSVEHYEVSIMDDDSWGYTTPSCMMSGFLTKGDAEKSAGNAYTEDLLNKK